MVVTEYSLVPDFFFQIEEKAETPLQTLSWLFPAEKGRE